MRAANKIPSYTGYSYTHIRYMRTEREKIKMKSILSDKFR